MTAEAIHHHHHHTAPPVAQPLLQAVLPPSYEPLVLCGCGHEQDTHEHYCSGTDCAICGPVRCRRFRRRTGRGARSSLRRTAR